MRASMAILLPICVESFLFTYTVLIIDIQGTYIVIFRYICICAIMAWHGTEYSLYVLEFIYVRTSKQAKQ